MTYIVCEPCIGTKDRACVEVCPVECFYEGTDQLYIHPEECIDCAACEPVCPVTAIFPEDSVPEQWKSSYTPKNYKFIEENPQAPHALTKAMLGDQDNFAHTFTVEGKTITLPPPPSGFGGPAPPPPKAAGPAPPKAEAAPPKAAAPPKPEAAPKAAAPPAAPAAAAPRTASAVSDAIIQIAEAAAAAAEAAARAAQAAAAAIRLLQGKADGRTGSGAPSAPAGEPQATAAARPAQAKAPSPTEAPAAAERQMAEARRTGPDPSFERAKEVLYALIDFESGARPADLEELARAEETATLLFEELAKAVGKRDYTLQDLEKKDVTLRQKMDLGNAIVDRVARVRLQIEIDRQRSRARAQIPGAVVSFAIAGACAALGLLYVLRYSVPLAGTPTLHDLLTAPFTPEGFMPFLGFNLLAGFFGLFGALALLKLARSWVEVCHLEALRPKEFGAASLRPRRWSWTSRLKIESERILEAQRMLQALTAKKR